jgi:hypothetical protein
MQSEKSHGMATKHLLTMPVLSLSILLTDGDFYILAVTSKPALIFYPKALELQLGGK